MTTREPTNETGPFLTKPTEGHVRETATPVCKRGERPDLRGRDLVRLGLHLTGLSGADLGEADLSEADLSKADLRQANLFKARPSQADLRGADLSGTNLRQAKMFGAELSEAVLGELIYEEPVWRGKPGPRRLVWCRPVRGTVQRSCNVVGPLSIMPEPGQFARSSDREFS